MNRSIAIALGIFIVLCLYMLTGLVGCGGSGEPPSAGPAGEIPPMSVQVREMRAVEIPREVRLTGRTVPSRSMDLKAETSGRIIEVAERRGKAVRKGDLIARIELDDRTEQLEQAKAGLEQARFEHEAALRLQDQGLRSASQVAQALSRLRGAEQGVRAIELDMQHTRLAAPFDAVLQDRMVEIGDYVGIGDPVARLIDLDPLVIEGEATEFQVRYLEPGELGHAELADAHSVDGTIRYVAGEAHQESRTFNVELEVPNPDNEIRAGITARIVIETERVLAHKVSAALISISDEGTFGIKTVNDANVVEFHPADVVKSEPQSLWLAGLPENIRIITVGQGFTKAGDRVVPVPEAVSWE